MIRSLLLLLLPLLALVAAEPADRRQAVVATVGGEAITLGQLEDEMLRREGGELLGDLVREALGTIPWRDLPEEGPVLVLPAGSLTRADLVAKLMPVHGAELLEELINLRVASVALERAGIAVDDRLLDAEVARAERKLAALLAKQGLPNMDLDTFLKDSKGTTLAEYRAQPGFRILIAGLHALVKREAVNQVGEEALKARFERDRARWALAEACDCSVLFIPFELTPGPDGRPQVTPAERERRTGVVASLHRQIAAQQMTFGAAFRAYARSYEPDADNQGRIGWLRRDGTRDDRPSARVIPPAVVEAAFAQRGPYPVLLPPIVHDLGVEIVQVHGWRPASQPDFATVRERLVDGLVEDELDARTKATLQRLRQAAVLDKRADGTIAVDGWPITPREVQNAVLAREGLKAARKDVDRLLGESDPSRVPPEGIILAGPGWEITRARFASRLLAMHGAKVREDLIGLKLLHQAVAKAGITADDVMVAEEMARLERAYRRSPEAAKRDFRTFVTTSYGAPPEALGRDEAFRAVAATSRLLRQQTVVEDDELKEFFARNAKLYQQSEAVDLAIIPLLYQREAGEADRARVAALANSVHQTLVAKPGEFATVWRDAGRPGDPYAPAGGRVGWIARDGRRDNPAARVIPPEVMEAAFAAAGPWPVLLPPIAHQRGIDVVVVHGRRNAEVPTFADLRTRLLQDYLESDWDQRLQSLVDRLRREAVIDYADLAALIRE